MATFGGMTVTTDFRNRIEAAYQRSGNALGWRFLYSPERTLGGARVAFIGLNPGGSTEDDAHGRYAMESGSAYPDYGPGDSLNVRSGHISSFKEKSAVQLIEVTQKLTQGMSGGPLLDDDGRVAGIIHKGGPQEGRDFAVHINALIAWLDDR